MSGGREPKLDGRKAAQGGRAIVTAPAPKSELELIPANLGSHGRHAWRMAVKSLAPLHLVSHGDLMALEMMCRAWNRYRSHEDEIHRRERAEAGDGEFATTPNGHVQMSALRIAADRAAKEFRTLALQFGLTPVARVRTAGSAQGDLFDRDPPQEAAAPGRRDETDPWGSLGALN